MKTNINFQENLESYSVHVCLFIMKGEGWPFLFYFIFYFISFIGHRNSRLQGDRPMGLVQTGKLDPCKAQPLNKSMTR